MLHTRDDYFGQAAVPFPNIFLRDSAALQTSDFSLKLKEVERKVHLSQAAEQIGLLSR